MNTTFYIIALSSSLFGALIVWFLFYKKSNQQAIDNQRFKDRISILETEISQLNNKLNDSELAVLESRNLKEQIALSNAELETELRLLKENMDEQSHWKTDFKLLQENLQVLESSKIRLEENIRAEKEKIAQQQEDFKLQREQLKSEFKNLAQEIMKSQSSEFATQSKIDIALLIEPMKEKLENFKKQVTDAYHEDERERFSLKNEIKNLLDLNKNLSEEAHNLSLALKGDNKAQGDWGEMILERILENSGLTKGREYFVQQSVNDEDNKRFRPDIIVKYPGDRCIIIDSKVSLKSYEQYVNSNNNDDQRAALKAHIESVKKHIKDLSAKKYQSLFTDCKSPEFVMMFLPIEPAYLLAVQNDPDLWINAYQKQILLISPTNLIAALRMIAELWDHDKQNKNVLKIAEESGKLVDKFVGFLEDFDKVGDYLKKSEEAFEKAKNKLKNGNGNLIGKAQRIIDLGAIAKKSLPPNYSISDED